MNYLMGYDIGSSSIKAALLEAETGRLVAAAAAPETELEISLPRPGWAEQDPEIWWENLLAATARIKAEAGVDLREVLAVGISYQMHGLVLVDREQRPLRPAIIWCDSRAVEIGARAFAAIGEEACLARFLNSPGNFTAAKLAWVKENEPEIYAPDPRRPCCPGDYIAMRMTGEIQTTPSGLSEGILWDFRNQGPAGSRARSFRHPARICSRELAPTFAVAGRAHRAGRGRARPAAGHARGLPGRRPAQQRLLPERPGTGRTGGHGRHIAAWSTG